jgi:hypothetical protein
MRNTATKLTGNRDAWATKATCSIHISPLCRSALLQMTLATSVLLAGCGSAPLAIPGLGGTASGQSESVAAAPNAPQSEVMSSVPIAGAELSGVTLRGLRSVGVTDLDGLVRWFNSPSMDQDPFLAPMRAELDGANGSASSLADLKLSSVTVEALAQLGVTTPSGIAGVDRKKLEEKPKPSDLCRNEIAREMQRLGWTVLRVSVTNRPGASSLMLNGTALGPIVKSDKPVWRRFLANIPGSESDLRAIATLTVDVPSAADGTPAARWFKDIELQRGAEVQVGVDVGSAPIPSIGFKPKTPLSPAAVYAGDTVELTCEGGNDETIWFAFVDAAELGSSNYTATPSEGASAAGLPAWFRLRTSAETASSPRGSLLDEPMMQPIVLGRGKSFVWKPQAETPSARIGALVRDSSGFWGFAERSIAVADLRPGLWSVPVLPLDPASAESAMRAAQAIDPSPINIYETHAILDQLLYVAKTGTPMVLDMRIDEYRDASLPIASVIVDFGDGTASVDVTAAQAANAQVEHTYAKTGDYRITVKSVDIMGFERVHGTNVSVRDDAPSAPPAQIATAAVGSGVKVRVAATAAESSFSLFRRAAEQFSRAVAARTASVCNGKKVGIAHIHDGKDQNLVDLMDAALVNTLLGSGFAVYEREPLFQHAIDGRGFIDSTTITVPDQGGRVPEGLLSGVKDGEKVDAALTMKLLDRIGVSVNPDVDVVIEYKLKRAEVSAVPAGAMTLRTARIFAWARVHDRRTMQILFDDAIEVSLGGTVAAAEPGAAGISWNSYPDGFLLRSGSRDKAIEKMEVTEAKSSEGTASGASAAPAPAPAAPSAAKPEGGVGGMLKNMFGG